MSISGVFVLFLYTFTLKVNGQRTPAISYISQEQIKDIGDTADLDCSVQYAQEYPVLWVKYDRSKSQELLPISRGSVLILRDVRLALDTVNLLTNSTYTLQVKDIQETDAGIYRCQIILSMTEKISAEVELKVRRKPAAISDNSKEPPTIEYISRGQIKNVSDSVELLCAVKHADEYPVLWMKEDRLKSNELLPISTGTHLNITDTRYSLLHDNATSRYTSYTLRIKDVQETDAGVYLCQIIVSTEKNISAEVKLEVRHKPVITGNISDNSTKSIDVPEEKPHGKETPFISFIPQDITQNIGDMGHLTCAVKHADEYPVVWVKDDRLKTQELLTISTGAHLNVTDKRYSLVHDNSNSRYTSYSLRIKNLQETDAGVYLCQIIVSTSKTISAKVELNIRRKPVIYNNSTYSVDVSEGEPVELECYADGFPPPRISWRRENNVILPTGGRVYYNNILKITSIRKEDGGTYYCVAENDVGKGARRNIPVQIVIAPVVTAPRPRIGQAWLYDIDLLCKIVAYPPPAIVWIKDSVQLSSDEHYRISNFATDADTTVTNLRIIGIKKHEYGLYTCKATNRLGSNETLIELFETIIPVCPPTCGD